MRGVVMELLLLLPMLLIGGLVLGGGNDSGADDDDAPTAEPGEEQTGTVLNDILLGGGGPDTLEGGEGNDVLVGDAGNDSLNGNAQGDLVLGGTGNDILRGALGDDLLIGGAGNDTLFGGQGDDELIGSSGSDTLFGGDGDDLLLGFEYDRISGNMADLAADLRARIVNNFDTPVPDQQLDRVEDNVTSGTVGERGPDQLNGGAGNDFLMGDDGDTLSGGEGDDDFDIAYRPGEAVTTITDFDYRIESLFLFVDNPDSASVSLVGDGPDTTLILIDGVLAVRLIGQSVADLSVNTQPWLELQAA